MKQFLPNSTLGFSPLSSKEEKWLCDDGKKLFLSLVKQHVKNITDTDIEIVDEDTIYQCLLNVIHINDESVVQDAVRFAANMLIGRINMHNRLESISNNMIRLEPRGGNDREKGCLPMKQVSQNSKYQQYLNDQKRFR